MLWAQSLDIGSTVRTALEVATTVRALHAPPTSRQRRPASTTTYAGVSRRRGVLATACERGGPSPATVIVTPSPVVGEGGCPCPAAEVARYKVRLQPFWMLV